MTTVLLLSRRLGAAIVAVGVVCTTPAAFSSETFERLAAAGVHGGGSDQAGREGRGGGQEQVSRETRTLTIGEAGSLELRTLSGDIVVTGGGGREARVEIVWRIRGSEDDLRRARERVTVAVDHQGDRASLATVYQGDRRSAPRVDVSYVVMAPAGTRVSAASTSGSLTVRNIKGDLSASVTSGTIEIRDAGQLSSARTVSGGIRLTNVASAAGMTVSTVSGDVTLDGAKSTRVEAETVSGSIAARNVTTDHAALRSLSGAIDFSGGIARVGRYEFQSHSGDITVAAGGPAGFQLQATTFSGTITPATDLNLKSITASRRSLRGTVGDGRAVVVATTFSGDVAIGKR